MDLQSKTKNPKLSSRPNTKEHLHHPKSTTELDKEETLTSSKEHHRNLYHKSKETHKKNQPVSASANKGKENERGRVNTRAEALRTF